MQSTLLAFIRVLRRHELPVSPAETLDALQVVNALGFGNRDRLRHGLAAALAKSEREQAVFELCFERFFSQGLQDFTSTASDQAQHTANPEAGIPERDGGGAPGDSGAPQQTAVDGSESASTDTFGDKDADELAALPGAALIRQIRDNERGALSAAIREAGQAAGLADIRLFTQKGQYVRKILEAMGEEQLRAAISDLAERDDPRAASLRQYRDILRAQVRDHVDAEYLLHAEGLNRQFLDEMLSTTRMNHIELHYAERVRELVQKMVRRLGQRHSRRRIRARRGQLHMGRTLRDGAAHDGVLWRTHWRQRRRDRSQVLAICDVSGSVAAYARFLLIFLYSLQDLLPRVRSFAFSSHLGEVSALFEEYPLEQAIEQVNRRYGGATDYGGSLRDFARSALNDINRSTSVIILGDARNNRGNPELDIMQSIYQRSKQVIWLNPEPRRAWGTGDSEMLRYQSACHFAAECNNLQQLERVIDQLLRSTR